MRSCELGGDGVFDVTSTPDADLAAVITLSYKSSFKFIKPSSKSNSETSHALSFETAPEASFKPAASSH